MRAITKNAVNSFWSQNNFSLNNTRVEIENDWAFRISKMFLHWNLIAEYRENAFSKNDLYISNCGWETTTTKERLNWILDYFNLWCLRQIKGQWYLINWDTKEEFNWEKMFII